MKILITGGTGLVGKEVGKKLADKGYELYVLTRNKEKAQLECPYPQSPILWDEIENHPVLENLGAIIHLAGTNLSDKRWNKKFKELIYNSRVLKTRQMVSLAKEKCHNLQCFISTSAIGIYGEADDTMADEDYTKSYNFLGKLCQDWEAPLNDDNKFRAVILRVGIVFSEKGGALQEMIRPIQMRIGGTLAGGKQYMSWIDIEDLSNMYIFAIENSISGTFNATAPNPETNLKICQSIAKKLNVRLGPNVPYFALRLAFGEMAPYIVESQKISPQKIQSKGFKFKYSKVEESIKVRV